MFGRRIKPGIDSRFVAPCIDAVPAVIRQENRIEAMEAEWAAGRIERQPLVAETGRDPVGPQESRKKMALGITESRAVFEDFRCRQRHRVHLVICAVPYLIADKEETALSNRSVINRPCTRQLPGHPPDRRVVMVDDPGCCKELTMFHGGRCYGIHPSRTHRS